MNALLERSTEAKESIAGTKSPTPPSKKGFTFEPMGELERLKPLVEPAAAEERKEQRKEGRMGIVGRVVLYSFIAGLTAIAGLIVLLSIFPPC
jgi:hypothetical protein